MTAAQSTQPQYSIDPKTFSIDGQKLPYDFPRCERLLSKSPFPLQAPPDAAAEMKRQIENAPLVWMIGRPHPIIPELVVMRMYVMPGVGVEVYSINGPGKDGAKPQLTGGMRYTMPWHMVLMTEEAMDLNTLGDEILAAEKDDSAEEEPEPAPALAANGAS